jgi:hypothetical protein
MATFEHISTSIQILWDWIADAPTQRDHPMRVPTIITSANNIPNARSMVLRATERYALIFFTDKRSKKTQEIHNNAHSVIHSYDPLESLQIRVRTQLTLLSHHPDQKKWTEEGLHRFSDYGSVSAPGSPLPQEPSAPPTLEIAQKNFCILHARVTDIELLKLSRKGHKRMEWRYRQEIWTAHHMTP